MPTTDRVVPDAAAAADNPRYPTLWTMALATALLGIVALPRRSAQPTDHDADRAGDHARGASGGDAARQESPSHEGADAHLVARTEQNRGRSADTPTEVPAEGWKDILKRTYRDIGENRLTLVSAGVTFFVLLAIFPAVAALVSVYGLIADVSTINHQIETLRGVLPSGGVDIVAEQVKRVTEKGDTTLGLTALIGIALSVWSANGGVKHVFDALNLVYNEREQRGFFRLNLVSLAFTAGALLFVVLALAGIVAVPLAIQFVGLSGDAWWLALLRWPVLFLIVILMLAVLYRYGPSRDAPRWRWVTTGGIVAGFLWLAGSLLFSWYVSNFGSYDKTYGSLGAAIGFMTWIWISTTIVLLGAQLNAEIEHQTAKDTTVGAPQPLGTRDARMADTVGAAA
ncbi:MULTISPECIES: YihY/virulence factor BrkB family protein [Methylorubrum]|uniref:YihY/virulence factor BrkB family protein n=1 Tax=Methylorubrum TaxID=2282523 RepID=UPI0020A0BF50|nr:MULTISPECIES: YihY/virulence factor BrkB family protein [Methylorubrum]MCP1548305.1 membrane protein [Methylorubrum zatmanii]MCP1555080.1 membrane protein [Methylorubrum extorquens]MCP1578608.1 membrane protein [Methylorubrum extorquens]